MSYRSFAAVAFVIMSACDLPPGFPTSPSANLPVTDAFAGSLDQNSSVTFVFSASQTGSIAVTVTAVMPSPVAIGLGFGTPIAAAPVTGTPITGAPATAVTAACRLTKTVSPIVPGPAAQITVTDQAGPHCVTVFDVGSLTAPSTVTVTVGHS